MDTLFYCTKSTYSVLNIFIPIQNWSNSKLPSL